MWAGANPRSRGPALDDADHIEDAEWHTTALAEACYSGSVESLKRLKPVVSHVSADLVVTPVSRH